MRLVFIPRKLGHRVIILILLLVGLYWLWGKYINLKEEGQAVKTMSWALAGQKIVIDPGHGGIDEGAIGPGGTPEAKINLAISKLLADMLKQGGAEVYLTREDDSVNEGDSGDDLVERVRLAKKVGADLFISIHCNAFDGRERGAQVFYDPGSEAGKKLGESIQSEIKHQLGNTDREPLGIDAFVLRSQNIPAVIVEVGFISNPKEEKLLADPHYQRRMAFAVYGGIVNYLAVGKE